MSADGTHPYSPVRAAPAAGNTAAWSARAAVARGHALVTRARWAMTGVDFGDLRRLTPISQNFGFDRGRPIDRHYVETFLEQNAGDVRGRVLEVGDNVYTRRFGGANVAVSDVLHVKEGVPGTTIVDDLSRGENIPGAAFNCIVLTQTLHLIFDMRAAVATLHRALKPSGVLLLTVPGVSSIARDEWGETWNWSLTPVSLRRLIEERFGPDGLSVTSFGNVLAATAFLYGLADRELKPDELAASDPLFPVVVAARVVKAP